MSEEISRMAEPDRAKVRIMRWTSSLAPISTPRVGSSRTRESGLDGRPTFQDYFLLIAPERDCAGLEGLAVLILR